MKITLTKDNGATAGFEYLMQRNWYLSSRVLWSDPQFQEGEVESAVIDGEEVDADFWHFLDNYVGVRRLLHVLNDERLGTAFIRTFAGELALDGGDLDTLLAVWNTRTNRALEMLSTEELQTIWQAARENRNTPFIDWLASQHQGLAKDHILNEAADLIEAHLVHGEVSAEAFSETAAQCRKLAGNAPER